ncbi:hypothetical protein NQZ68_008585, partial [Dissostichus eleginoides]
MTGGGKPRARNQGLQRQVAGTVPTKRGNNLINAEFQRIMTIPLEEKFMAQLDIHSSQLITVIRAKGGSTRQKTADIMDIFDQ